MAEIEALTRVQELSAELSPAAGMRADTASAPGISGALAAEIGGAAALGAPAGMSGELASPAGMAAELTVPSSTGAEAYAGPYDITPTQSDQVFRTVGRVMSDDIVVRAIPSNYGRIEWNGSVLTVS